MCGIGLRISLIKTTAFVHSKIYSLPLNVVVCNSESDLKFLNRDCGQLAITPAHDWHFVQ